VTPIEIQRKAVEMDLEVFRSKLPLQQALVDAHIQKAIKERRLVGEVIAIMAPAEATVHGAFREWKMAHIADSKAREDILRFELAQTQSQVYIREAMLREGEKNIVTPGAFKV
jgi:hypothetical protein